MKLLFVEWYDSQFQPNEWIGRGYVEITKRHVCISVGFLLKETNTEILLCPNITKVEGAQGITIPKCSIKRMWKLGVR